MNNLSNTRSVPLSLGRCSFHFMTLSFVINLIVITHIPQGCVRLAAIDSQVLLETKRLHRLNNDVTFSQIFSPELSHTDCT